MIRITLPLPPRQLSPNGRCHWRAKAKAVKAYRQCAAQETMVAAFENRRLSASWPWRHVSIEIRYYSRTRNFKDPDNIMASLKAGIDGLTDGGLLADDKDVTYPPVVRDVDAKNPRVELVVQEQQKVD